MLRDGKVRRGSDLICYGTDLTRDGKASISYALEKHCTERRAEALEKQSSTVRRLCVDTQRNG